MKLGATLLLALALAASPSPAPSRALWGAVKGADEAGVAEALARGENPLDCDASGRTLLHVAAASGQVALVIRFLDLGVAPDAQARDGSTPLMLASAEGHLDVVRVLFLRGARVTAVDSQGRTALDVARARGEGAVARLLQAAMVKAPSPQPRARRTPPATAVEQPWRPSIPPWSPDPPSLALPDVRGRFATLLARIDRAGDLPAKPPLPAYKPLDRWIGETFVFLPRDPDNPHEYPSFETREDVSAYPFDPSYAALAGRFGVVLQVVTEGRERYVDIRLDGEPIVLRGRVNPTGTIPEIALVSDLAIARRLYLGKTVLPSGPAAARFKVPAGRPVRILEIAPASSSRHPVRMLVEAERGRRFTVDLGLSGTNSPLAVGRPSFDAIPDAFDVIEPRPLRR